ncbi:heme ABC transporter ATP-binding protein/permease CydC [Endozoicomonadaceae bacterium StTr2]
MMHELWPFLKLYRHQAGRLSLGMLLAFITLAASVSLLALSGWFITATAIAGLSFATAQSFNFFTPGAGVRGFSILRTAGRYFDRLVSHDATFRLLAWLRTWFYYRLLPFSAGELSIWRKGELLNRLVADIDALDQLYLRLLSPIFVAFLATLTLGALLAVFNADIAVLIGTVLMVLLIVTPFVVYQTSRKPGEAMAHQQSEMRTRLLDYLGGQAELLIFDAEQRYRDELRHKERELLQSQEKMAWYAGLSQAMLMLAAGATVLLVMYLAAEAVHKNYIDGPVMTLMVLGTLAAFEAFHMLPGAFRFLGYTRTSARRLHEVVKTPSRIVFPDEEHSLPDISQGSVTLDNIWFRYPNGLEDTVKGLSLQVEPGEHVAILGRTGCGKSTLYRLLTRDWDPDRGVIKIDGHLLESYNEVQLRQGMRVVPQRVHVFEGTLRDNLKIGDPDASDGKLYQLLKDLELSHMAHSPQDLLNIWLGAGGVRLSGGEARRLGIARALLQPAPLLLLDEPTEGLDTVTANRVMQGILKAAEGRTLLLITHRRTALEHMDRIVRMDAGKLL